MPYLNLVITMVLGGLWHGVTWTFAVWGLLHGTRPGGHPLPDGEARPFEGAANPAIRALAVFCTYQFVCLTWIFFRAGSLSNAWAILSRIASLTAGLENISAMSGATMLLAAAALFVGKEWARARDRVVRGCAVLRSRRGAGGSVDRSAEAGRTRQRAVRVLAVLSPWATFLCIPD